MKSLIQRMQKGDRRALARLLSYVENQDKKAFELLKQIWPHTGRTISVGITGPAGGGKSTLLDQLISLQRTQKKKVGVIAVDPSSPFSGGAVLGDRIRMQRHSSDPDVFIRSVGSRGQSGGVSFSTRALMHLLDAFGVDVVFVETVGAGQSEVDIVDLVDTTVVVLTPEAGDSIQALKAGLLEIADIFVVNKKDRDGADRMKQEISAAMSMQADPKSWMAPVLLTEAPTGEGVEALWTHVERHQAFLRDEGVPKEERLRRHLHALHEILRARVANEVLEGCRKDSTFLDELSKSTRPNLYALADNALSRFRSGGKS